MTVLPIVWVTCGAVIVAAALKASRSRRALDVGLRAVAVLYIGAGALVNAFFLLRGDDYGDFAEASYIPFVRDTWESLVVPHHDIWISLLIVFELAVGLLALSGGKRAQVGLGAAVAFHVALLSFGWGFYLWSVPMIAALTLLLRAERRPAPEPAAVPVPPAGTATATKAA